MEHPMIGKFVKVYVEEGDDELEHVFKGYQCELVHICETHVTLWVYDAEVNNDTEYYDRTSEKLAILPIRNIFRIDADKYEQEEDIYQLPFQKDEHPFYEKR